MTYAQVLTSLGIVLGMTGVVVIFIFGPPQPNLDEGVGLGLEDGTPLSDGRTVADHNDDIKICSKQYALRSKIGLALVFAGFLLQLIGAWV